MTQTTIKLHPLGYFCLPPAGGEEHDRWNWNGKFTNAEPRLEE